MNIPKELLPKGEPLTRPTAILKKSHEDSFDVKMQKMKEMEEAAEIFRNRLQSIMDCSFNVEGERRVKKEEPKKNEPKKEEHKNDEHKNDEALKDIEPKDIHSKDNNPMDTSNKTKAMSVQQRQVYTNQQRKSNTPRTEREEIRDFWLSLSEEERKQFVSDEKESVIKIWKDQQRFSCNCSFCSRKRVVIEDEIETLYDAYFEGLENFTLQLREMDSRRQRGEKNSFSSISCTIKGEKVNTSLAFKAGIMNVADSLMKNDARRFLEIMDRIAEKRLREDFGDDPHHDEDDDMYDDDYLEDEDDFYDDEEMITEEEQIEEGRRIFQVIAAQTFEKRVSVAYREKVAREKQQQLIDEMEEQERLQREREEAKQKSKQRKKERKKRLKEEKERMKEEKEKEEREEKERVEREKREREEREEREKREREEKEMKAKKDKERLETLERLEKERKETEAIRQAEELRLQLERKEAKRKKAILLKEKQEAERLAYEIEQQMKELDSCSDLSDTTLEDIPAVSEAMECLLRDGLVKEVLMQGDSLRNQGVERELMKEKPCPQLPPGLFPESRIRNFTDGKRERYSETTERLPESAESLLSESNEIFSEFHSRAASEPKNTNRSLNGKKFISAEQLERTLKQNSVNNKHQDSLRINDSFENDFRDPNDDYIESHSTQSTNFEPWSTFNSRPLFDEKAIRRPQPIGPLTSKSVSPLIDLDQNLNLSLFLKNSFSLEE